MSDGAVSCCWCDIMEKCVSAGAVCCRWSLVAGVRGAGHRVLYTGRHLPVGNTSKGGTGTSRALPAIPREWGDVRRGVLRLRWMAFAGLDERSLHLGERSRHLGECISHPGKCDSLWCLILYICGV